VAKAGARAGKRRAKAPERAPRKRAAASQALAEEQPQPDPAPESLLAYRGKRDFARSPEPKGRPDAAAGGRFCVQ
jgi:hypothetical protein